MVHSFINIFCKILAKSSNDLHDHCVHNAPHESHDQLHGCCDELPCVLLHSECVQPPHTLQYRWCQQCVHTRHVPDVLVSCGTGGPSCHGNEDHLSIHDELGQPHAWQERLHHRQDWWRGGVLGLAFWILGERRLPN